MIEGRLLYPNGGDMEATLRWAPRSDYPTLQARPNEEGPYLYRPPEARDDGWPVGDAQAAGVAPAALEQAVDAIARGDAGLLKSFLVARGGTLILEEYFHGYGPQDLVPIRSCTKSISSLLVGLAIQEGLISGVDVPLLDFFPNQREQAGSGWDDLTLEHLLTMSLALDWAPPQTQDLHGTGPEAFRQILARNVEGVPGQDFEYVNMNVNLLAGVLKEATGEQAEALAERGLFQPLGITRWNWEDMKTNGFNLMDGSLRLRPRDMAKVGVMVGQGGTWRGQRILEESWVRASLEPRLPAGDRGEGYGYLWWTMPIPGPRGQTLQAVFANGWGSQFILLVPELDLVIVTTGGNMENGKHLAVGDVLIRDLIPGVAPGG
jgi:CubicO group peptidase (beta-lactamase class C family)